MRESQNMFPIVLFQKEKGEVASSQMSNRHHAARCSFSDGAHRCFLSHCIPGTLSTTLFEATGSTSTYKNQWTYWFTSGSTVSSGYGKRSAYDSTAISELMFEDAAGKYARYSLTSSYTGRTLLSIVQGCLGTSPPSNTGSSTWTNGHCTVGTLTGSSGLSGVTSLRIGVGDGSADSADWALFMPLSGNGGGDYMGRSTWAFGGESRTNNGYTGVVTISASMSFDYQPTRLLI